VFSLYGLFAEAQNSQTYTVTNRTGINITSIYISESGAAVWGNSINTKDKLLNNESFLYTQVLDNKKCNYDIKFTADDGKDYILKNINLCSAANITLIKPDQKKLEEKKPY
jgi:hypothetical protein